METRLGFSGSRKGMSEPQRAVVRERLERFQGGWLHHGLCIGSDAQAHALARAVGLKVAGHPGPFSVMRAWLDCDVLYPPNPYLTRNHHIVDSTEELIATPRGRADRSGTWATIRYAQQQRRLVTIVYPDGSLEFSP